MRASSGGRAASSRCGRARFARVSASACLCLCVCARCCRWVRCVPVFVCVCMYVCMYVCVYVCICMGMRDVYVHAFVCVRVVFVFLYVLAHSAQHSSGVVWKRSSTSIAWHGHRAQQCYSSARTSHSSATLPHRTDTTSSAATASYLHQSSTAAVSCTRRARAQRVYSLVPTPRAAVL